MSPKLRELVENINCREGKYAGREAGCKFWQPFESVVIERNTINQGRDIISTFTFEIRHFKDGDMRSVIRFNDRMDEKYSREWDVSEVLNCISADQVAARLRLGLYYCDDKYGEPVYWTPLDTDGWENLLTEFQLIGFTEADILN